MWYLIRSKPPDTYAIVPTLRKYESQFAFQRVEILADHQSLESPQTNHINPPSGPAGRRARWHECLLELVVYLTYLSEQVHLVLGLTHPERHTPIVPSMARPKRS